MFQHFAIRAIIFFEHQTSHRKELTLDLLTLAVLADYKISHYTVPQPTWYFKIGNIPDT
jgi:hypothetical protein